MSSDDLIKMVNFKLGDTSVAQRKNFESLTGIEAMTIDTLELFYEEKVKGIILSVDEPIGTSMARKVPSISRI